MRKYTICFIVAVVICLIPPYVCADEYSTWEIPPGVGWSDELPRGWNHPYPYQRDIYVDFSTDPLVPVDPEYIYDLIDDPSYLPPDYNGIPGAVYDGSADDDLKSYDWVYYEDVGYQSNNERIGIGAKYEERSGGGLIHLNNLNNSSGYKQFYIEAHLTSNDPLGIFTSGTLLFGFEGFGPADEYALVWDYEDFDYWSEGDHYYAEGPFVYADVDVSTGAIYIRTWGEIIPNPNSEFIMFAFSEIPDGKYIWLHDIHVATHCTPIPTSVWLLGSGLIGIVGIRRKFKK